MDIDAIGVFIGHLSSFFSSDFGPSPIFEAENSYANG